MDWLGVTLSLLIILAIIVIIIARMQGDNVVDVLQQFVDFIKGK